MKNFVFFFVFFFLGISSVVINAQPWELQTASGLTVAGDPLLLFSAVDHNVCWGIEGYFFGSGVTNPKFVLTTDGGQNWSVTSAQIPSGCAAEAIYARDAHTAWLAVDDPNNGTNSGIYRTTNSGVSWQRLSNAFAGGGHPAIVYFFNKSDTGISIGNPRNNHFEIYKTTDGGVKWDTVHNIPLADFGDDFPTLYSGSGNTFLFGSLLRKVYRSSDRGSTWGKISYTAAPSGAGVAIQLKDDLNGLACTYFGDHVNRVARTTDGGLSWTPIQPLPLSKPSFYFFSYVPGTPGTYVITSHNNKNGEPETTTPGSAYSIDGGGTWYKIDSKAHGWTSFSDDGWGWSGGIGDTIYRIHKDVLVLPVELTSFSTNTIGNVIELIWQTATETNNKGFEIYRNGKRISFIDGKGTTTEKQNYSFVDKGLSAGKYKYMLKQIDYDGTQKIVGEKTVNLKLPEQFSLGQNYPNPFNPSTKIEFTIPQSSFVNLKIYNVLGEEVATLVNETKAAGNYEVNFSAKGRSASGGNTANLPSGIYFYKLQAGNFSESKKMILLK
jgi:photosystem II stability/assembly factor-like uncharacterized protein